VHAGSPSRWPLAVAAACVVVGLAVLGFALGSRADEPDGPATVAAVVAPSPAPAIVTTAPTPAPAATGVAGDPIAEMRAAWRRKLQANERAHVPAAWVAGFYPLYERAQAAFGVNWLLIASVHLQETAFSTAPGTYRGLNFAHCCAGPMQFNVTNGGGRGSPSTWELYRDAYREAERPASYPNPTAKHPSVYDDFDAIMAGASLLSDGGAGTVLDGSAWQAAYDYYGHDLDGIGYADEVVARAIGWSQGGFSINQPVDPALREAVDAAWGAPARATLLAADAKPARHKD
jgi:hypothetical protein